MRCLTTTDILLHRRKKIKCFLHLGASLAYILLFHFPTAFCTQVCVDICCVELYVLSPASENLIVCFTFILSSSVSLKSPECMKLKKPSCIKKYRRRQNCILKKTSLSPKLVCHNGPSALMVSLSPFRYFASRSEILENIKVLRDTGKH